MVNKSVAFKRPERIIRPRTADECLERLESSPLYLRREREWRETHREAIDLADQRLSRGWR
jgi:hypothetical protein